MTGRLARSCRPLKNTGTSAFENHLVVMKILAEKGQDEGKRP